MRKEWTDIVDGKEERYVDNVWYEFEVEKMHHELTEYCGGYKNQKVEIYDEKDRQGYEKPQHVDMQVNWSAIGTVPVHEALEFMNQVQKAIELAENFKYGGYIVCRRDDWTEEEKQVVRNAYKEAGLEI